MIPHATADIKIVCAGAEPAGRAAVRHEERRGETACDTRTTTSRHSTTRNEREEVREKKRERESCVLQHSATSDDERRGRCCRPLSPSTSWPLRDSNAQSATHGHSAKIPCTWKGEERDDQHEEKNNAEMRIPICQDIVEEGAPAEKSEGGEGEKKEAKGE